VTENFWTAEMDAALESNPPVIEWRKRPNGIYVPVSVFDPHPDGGHNRTKTHCKHNHEFTPENTIITRDGRQCRTCKNVVTSVWQATRVLTPEQRARKNEQERVRRRLRRQRDAMEAEAREAAERFEKHRADNTSLMRAAKASI
jgi:hypothetical protein